MFIIFNCLILYNLSDKKVTLTTIKPKIVLICHVFSNPYWQDVKVGAEKAARERNAVIDFEGPDNASADEGIRFINMAYAAKVSGIIVYVQDESKYVSVINKVMDSGIPLVTVDSDAENSKRLAYVGTDNISAGRVAGEEMINQIGATGKVAIIMGGRNVKNQIERVEGFNQYLSKNSKIVIAQTESSDSYLLEAELAAKKILKDNTDIKAIFCSSAQDGEGALKAVNTLGLSGKVKIICFDDLPETLEGIKDGGIAATIVQKPYVMGYKAVNIIMDRMEGKEVNGVFLTDVLVVRKENLNEYKNKQGDFKVEGK